MDIRFKLRRAALMGGTGLALMIAAGAAQAQTTPAVAQTTEPDTVEEITVTGIRRGIEGAISLKKDSTSIVEAVSAEDIGKLPDVSIAESIARLPGLTAQRLDGRGQVISIRGLAPDFTTALLNGREQVSTGDNRGVEFDQYPSELLSGVVIYKTPDASLLGQGLAGTADMRTIRPLKFGKRAFAVGARYEWNDIGALNPGSSAHGNRFNISYIDQFMDGKLGVAIGYAHMESPYQAQRFNAWGYPTDGAGNLVLGGARVTAMSSKLKRDGVMATVEFAPTDTFTSTLDVFYSKFENHQLVRGMEIPLAWGGGATDANGTRPGPAISGTTASGGMITNATYSNVKPVIRNDGNDRDADIWSLGWNNKWTVGDSWTIDTDLSWSKVERTDMILETYAGTGRNTLGALDTVSFSMSDHGASFKNALNYGDPAVTKLTSSQGWGGDVVTGGQDGYLNMPTIEDELKAARFSAKRDLNPDSGLSSITFGVNYSERTKGLVNDEWFLSVVGAPASVTIPSSAILGVTSLGFAGLSGVVAYDPFSLLNNGTYTKIRNPNADVLVKSWEVEEKVTVGYLMANIETEVGGHALTGNFGFQVVNTDQSSNALGASGTGTATQQTQLSGGTSYVDFLPSVNLQLRLPNEQVIRFAAARTLARPRMDQMRASTNYSYNSALATSTSLANSPWSGSGGNPELEPWRANAIDVSYEKYFGRQAYVSLAAFYKDLKTYVYDASVLHDFTGYPIGANPEPVLRQGYITIPQNGQGGSIKGLEFTVSMPGSLIHPVLEGFGAIFSASRTESEIQYSLSDPSIPIPGLSKTVGNLTVYYEKGGFSARLSERYRSKFLGEVSGFGNGRTYRMVKEETVLDSQIGYSFENGPLKGLSLTAQVNNLTNEPFVTYQNGDERQIIDYQEYGRTYLVGVAYKF